MSEEKRVSKYREKKQQEQSGVFENENAVSKLKRLGKKEQKESAGFSIMLQNFTLNSIYRKLILLSLFSTVTFIFYLFGLLYLTDEEVEPRYIPVANDGKVFKVYSLDHPLVADGDIINDAIKVSKMLYTFDFKNWKTDQQILRASSHFEGEAWREYQKALIASKNMEAVNEGRMVVSVAFTDTPKIKSRKNPHDNVYEWEVTIPMLITYETSNIGEGNKIYANTLVQKGKGEFRYRRTPIEENPRQYNIVRYRFEPAASK